MLSAVGGTERLSAPAQRSCEAYTFLADGSKGRLGRRAETERRTVEEKRDQRRSGGFLLGLRPCSLHFLSLSLSQATLLPAFTRLLLQGADAGRRLAQRHGNEPRRQRAFSPQSPLLGALSPSLCGCSPEPWQPAARRCTCSVDGFTRGGGGREGGRERTIGPCSSCSRLPPLVSFSLREKKKRAHRGATLDVYRVCLCDLSVRSAGEVKCSVDSKV